MKIIYLFPLVIAVAITWFVINPFVSTTFQPSLLSTLLMWTLDSLNGLFWGFVIAVLYEDMK